MNLDPTLSYGCGHRDGEEGKPIRGSSPEYEDGHRAGRKTTPRGALEIRIEDLKEEIEYGFSDNGERDELFRAEQKLADMDRDDLNDGKLSLERLDNFESEQRCVHRHIIKTAKEIAAFRCEDIPEQFSFDSYERETAEGWAIKEWPKGTRLISVSFVVYYNGGGDHRTVRFPETYLDIDWKPLEQALLDAERAKKAEEQARASAEHEARERAQFERLQAKFGDVK